jgi:hypothetical protein
LDPRYERTVVDDHRDRALSGNLFPEGLERLRVVSPRASVVAAGDHDGVVCAGFSGLLGEQDCLAGRTSAGTSDDGDVGKPSGIESLTSSLDENDALFRCKVVSLAHRARKQRPNASRCDADDVFFKCGDVWDMLAIKSNCVFLKDRLTKLLRIRGEERRDGGVDAGLERTGDVTTVDAVGGHCSAGGYRRTTTDKGREGRERLTGQIRPASV